MQQWLVLQRAMHVVERKHRPKIYQILQSTGKIAARKWNKTRDYVVVDRAVRRNFDHFLYPEYMAMYKDAARECGPLVVLFAQMRRKADDDLIDPWSIPGMSSWFDGQAASKVVGVTNVTMKGISRIIETGMRADWSIDEFASAISSSYGFSATRAERIARTEVQTASMKSQFEMGGQMYNPNGLTKSWLATGDHRTRPTHVTAGITQKEIPYRQPFSVGGSEAMFPGDPKLPARECVNCRCSMTIQVQLLPWDF